MTEDKPGFDWAKARMSDEALKEFVLDYCDKRIFTDAEIPEQKPRDVGLVFMTIGLGGLSKMKLEDVEQIGRIWEHMRNAGPRAINGMPTFMSCRLMHKDDWARAKKAILKELKRREEIEV